MNQGVEGAARCLKRHFGEAPPLGIVLGSGFGAARLELKVEQALPFKSVPGFPPAAVEGHSGWLRVGQLEGERVLVQAGRAHYYEGHSLADVTFPVRALAAWGIETLLLTNAAGGIRGNLAVGDFMVIRDHINLMGENPLRGPAAGRSRFVDLTLVYDRELITRLRRAARRCRLRLSAGVYLAVGGPSFETPAEIRAFRKLGADAVGMSTVPEAIVARHCGLRVVAVSLITNRAAGLSRSGPSHGEVLGQADRSGRSIRALLAAFVKSFRGVDGVSRVRVPC